jgi:putative CocE/NonD family hydrolase
LSAPDSQTPPPHYDRPPTYEKMAQDRDVMVPMRDGIHLCVDVYRPGSAGRFPALLAFAPHNKDLQAPEACEGSGPQPAWAPLWFGGQEAGDTRFLVSRGYVHVIGNPRGVGKSEDGDRHVPGMFGSPTDLYDLIEWIAVQPWCDANVGMVGISAYAGAQWHAAMQHPPHLKAIFPYDAFSAFSFRDFYPGGVVHTMMYLLDQSGVGHLVRGRPQALAPALEEHWRQAMENPDYRMYPHIYNVLTQKGQHTPAFFHTLIDPYDHEGTVPEAEAAFNQIHVPAYTGAGWYAYSYKLHEQGCQNWYENIKVPKKLLFAGPAHLERPFHAFHGEILRWYDHWLRGIDTGVTGEPPVKMWVMGANDWFYADDWPVPETKWTKYYLHSWERLREEPFVPASRDASEHPDAFLQMPPTQTRVVQKLRYLTDPLAEDTLIAGPCALKLFAAIDQTDTNWIVVLKDVGPDPSQRTAREGETLIPTDLPERELTRGWLKASHRALDPTRSKPYKPWHRFTREAQMPVVPGGITEYDIEILSTANLFEKGHRICLEITSADMPTGTAGFTNVEYIPYHICASKTTVHKIYHSERYPSYLLLPVIPSGG